jgi:hypothetical protein
MAEQDDTAALKAQLATLKAFLADHPEVAAELGVPDTSAAGPPVPLTFHGIVHELVDRLHGIDQERRDQMHDVIADHEADAPYAGLPKAEDPEPEAPAEQPPPA